VCPSSGLRADNSLPPSTLEVISCGTKYDVAGSLWDGKRDGF